MTLHKRVLLFLLFTGLGCSAQSAPANPSSGELSQNELSQRIERQLRASYDVPEEVKVTVSNSHPSTEFANYDTLTVTLDQEGKKRNLEFLLSKDQKTLIRLSRLDLSKDPYAETMKKINVKDRPVRGNPNAKVLVVNFDDFECPFCSRAHQTLFPELFKEYGDKVAFIYKDFPLSEIHPWAIHAAVDANCLAAQSNDAYWDFADYIHNNQSQVNQEHGRENQFAALDRITTTEAAKFKVDSPDFKNCVKAQKADAVMASVKEGESLGIDGTPTMFVNGRMVNGARSASEFRDILDSALQQAGVAPPAHPAAKLDSAPAGSGSGH